MARKSQTRWGSVAFMLIIHAVTLAGVPWYARTHGIDAVDWALFGFYSLATVLAITVGYHRLFSHVAFKAHPAVQSLLLFFGAATFQQSAMKWSSQHRKHHKFVDTPEDPYNIQYGFFYAHMGWILFWKHPVDYENVQDLQKNPLVMFQHKHFQACALIAGVAVPALIGLATGHLAGALIMGVAARLTLIFHVTFFINSYAHTFGSANYDYLSSARDHWLGAILTNGEGYHNYHHRFPSDYRNGIRWYHWDPSKWLIWALARTGLVSELKRTPPFRILEARLRAENYWAEGRLRAASGPSVARALSELNARYERIAGEAARWEDAVRKNLDAEARKAENEFKKMRVEWRSLVGKNGAGLERQLAGATS